MTDEEREMTTEVAAEESELVKLRRERESLIGELASARDRIKETEQALAERDGRLAQVDQSLEDAEKSLNEASENLSRAVAAYRELILSANPGMLPEMINGNSIDEVDESLRNAQSLVSRVKQEMEAETARTRVPAGAPQRAPLDLSALSSREKIEYGIGGKR